MKYLILAVAVVSLIGCSKEDKKNQVGVGSQILGGTATVPAEYSYAYLLMGQSNMARNTYFPITLNDSHALIIQCAVEGSPMYRWIPSGDLYLECVNKIPQDMPIAGVFFFQGESDALAGLTVPSWSGAFISMVQDLRTKYRSTLPVVFAQLGAHAGAGWAALQQDQASICLPHVSMITTDDLPLMPDGLHFTQESYQVIADRMVKAYERIK